MEAGYPTIQSRAVLKLELFGETRTGLWTSWL